MYIIGLTGNIACGKSTVLHELERRGAAVIDADTVTRQLQEPGQQVYRQIVEAFGSGVVTMPGGPIDRKALAAIVFTDPPALKRLESIAHPAVREFIFAWLEEQGVRGRGPGMRSEQSQTLTPDPRPLLVIDAIKLLESGWKTQVNAVWVVTCTPEQQLHRLMQTRGMSEQEAQMRIAAQPPQTEKVVQADVVIDNSGTLEKTLEQIETAWNAVLFHREE